MHPQLTKLHHQFAKASQLARDLSAGLSIEQFILRTDPERWSVAENLVHLSRTSEALLPTIRGTTSEGGREIFLAKGLSRRI